MDKDEYLRLMNFPTEWEEWGMIPNEWLEGAIQSYEPGMENASEHDRNGAFHWWLKRSPSEAQLIVLAKLANLDPDPPMAEFVKEQICKAKCFSPRVASLCA